ncbi:S8 family serine peptidase [bacterium]|nr:S8 family serine peptidase [bacterium]
MPRRFACLLLLFTALGAVPDTVPGATAGTLSPGLARLLAAKTDPEPLTVLVVLADRVDAPALAADLRARRLPRAERHRRVVTALQERARASQRELLADLERGGPGGGVAGFTPHWLLNAVVVRADAAAIRALAARPDVARVEVDLVPALVEPVAPPQPRAKAAAGSGIAPGVVAVGARRVWDELGFDGTGTLIGLIDSGADVAHPAFAARWRGNFAPTAEAWRDVAQRGQALPTDVTGHGTHVLGIAAGVAAGDTIGVAPGAQWIATNGIVATAAIFDNAILSSLEFMTDPDGDPATLDDVPDVVNNSWGVNESFAGYVDCDSRWWEMIDNCEAAGVVLVWAAGNEGPGGGTVRSPADRASNPYNCFAVGATSSFAPWPVAGFSSRGPSGCGGLDAIKPEVSAPGDSILSAFPGGGYGVLSGTSMATPHVAGVVALMRQANPDVDPVTIKDLLLATARDLGDPGEDNASGHGLVDAYAAVLAVQQGIGTVAGVVSDAVSGAPVPGAVITHEEGYSTTVADALGRYSLTMYAGPVVMVARSFGYFPGSRVAVIPDGGSVAGDIALTPLPSAVVSGTVRGPDGLAVAGAAVRALGTPVAPALSDGAGSYALTLPVGAVYELRADAPDLGAVVATVALAADLTLDFDLPVLNREDWESGGFLSFPWTATGDFPWQIDTTTFFAGAASARAADVINDESSGLALAYYVSEPGELSFRFKVSSEEGFDGLQFRIDDRIVTGWSGEVDWTFHSVDVAKGHHTFEWIYLKDPAVSRGQDTAWLDDIVLPPTGEEQFPDVAVTPASLVATLTRGQKTERVLGVANAGGEVLTYGVTLAEIGGQARPAGPAAAAGRAVGPGTAPSPAPSAKGVEPAATVVIRPTGAGGPDGYGYTWTDSDAPDGPLFGWVDLPGGGQALPPADDYSHGPVALGFPFVFYGAPRDTVRIDTNGFLSFASTGSPYLNAPLPDGAAPHAVVAAFWDDLDPSAGGLVSWWADGANDRFLVQYTDVPRYGTDELVTCQVELAADGSITCRYAAVGTAGSCTVGIENDASDDGLTAVHDAPGALRPGYAIRFEPPGFLPWVSVSPLAGTVAPGGADEVQVRFDATGLAAGPHVAVLTVASNDPDQPVAVVSLVLYVNEVTAAPEGDLPAAVALSGAVPNPFNPRTEVRYALPRATDVSLRVHDVRGHLVRELVAGRRPAGRHAAVWDGTDAAGRAVASGTYFARLVADGEVRVTRMALVR